MEATAQGANLHTGSDWGFSVVLKDTLILGQEEVGSTDSSTSRSTVASIDQAAMLQSEAAAAHHYGVVKQPQSACIIHGRGSWEAFYRQGV